MDGQAAFFECVRGGIVNTQLRTVQSNVQSRPDTLTGFGQPGVPFQIGEQNVAILFHSAHEVYFSFGKGQMSWDLEVGW